MKHETSTTFAADFRGLYARCLCGWKGATRGSVSEAEYDAQAHEADSVAREYFAPVLSEEKGRTE